jgi:hypothetical protein
MLLYNIFQTKFEVVPNQEHIALRNDLSLMAVGLHGPPVLHLQDAAQLGHPLVADAAGLQDYQTVAVVHLQDAAQLGLRDPLVADAAGLQGHQTVAVGLPDPSAAVAVSLQPAVQHCLVELQLPLKENLRVAVQPSLVEPQAPREEPLRAVVQPCLVDLEVSWEEPLPATATSVVVDELRVRQEGVQVLAHCDLAPVVGSGFLHHPLAIMTCVRSPLVSNESSIWKKLIVSTPHNFLTAATASLASSPWTPPSSTAALSMPSPWSTSSTPARSCTTSSRAAPTMVSASALETRITSSIPPPATSSSSRQSVLISGSLQLPAFSKSGPLGSQGESITVEEL